MRREIINAVITGARIDDGERGMLTAWIDVDHENGSQSFGGYALYLEHNKIHGICHIVKNDWFYPSVDFQNS